MKRVYIIAGVIFILVFMVWELGRICYNVDLDSILKKTENSLLDTSQEKNQYLNYQIINGNLYLQKEDGLYQYNYENGEEEKILENSMEDFMIIGDKIYYTKVNNNAIELYNCLSLFCENIGKDNSKKLVGNIENCIFNKSFVLFCRKKENELLHQIDRGRRISSKSAKTTLNEYFDNWLELYAKSGRKATTCTNYKSYYNTYIRETIGKKTITKVSKADIQKIINDMVRDGKKHSTLANLKSCLKSLKSLDPETRKRIRRIIKILLEIYGNTLRGEKEK